MKELVSKKSMLILTVAVVFGFCIKGLALETVTYRELCEEPSKYSGKQMCLYAFYASELRGLAAPYNNILKSNYVQVRTMDKTNLQNKLPIVVSSSILKQQLDKIEMKTMLSLIGNVRVAIDRKTKIKDYYFLLSRVTEGIATAEDFKTFKAEEYEKASTVRMIIQQEQYLDKKVCIETGFRGRFSAVVGRDLDECTDVTSENHFSISLDNLSVPVVVSNEYEKCIILIEDILNPKATPEEEEGTVRNIPKFKAYGMLKTITNPMSKRPAPYTFFYLMNIERIN